MYLDSKDNDVSGRNACLELCYALYLSLGGELAKLLKLMGDLSERSSSMVEDRIRQKNKQAGGLGSALGAFATHGSSSSTAGSNSNGNGNGHSSSSQSISVPASNQSTAASKRNVVLTSNNVPATSFTSPDRGSRESYENSPSPFRLEITPPQSEAGGDHAHNVSTVRSSY